MHDKTKQIKLNDGMYSDEKKEENDIFNDFNIFLYAGYEGLKIATSSPGSKHARNTRTNAPDEPLVTKTCSGLILILLLL